MRGTRGVADRGGDRPGQAAALDCLLGVVRIDEAESASNDQPERQQPQEQPIGEAPGENARSDALVSFDIPDWDRNGDVPSV